MEEEFIINGDLSGHGIPANEYFGDSSVNEFIFKKISKFGKTLFQVDGVSGKSMTFEELFEKAKNLGASLKKLRILPGETVTVSSENRLECSTAMLASLFIGAVYGPINPTYSPDEIVHVLNISKPRVIFCSAVTYSNILLVLPRLQKNHIDLVLFDEVPSTTWIKYNTMLQSGPIEKPHQSKDKDIAVILTSSGTTGLPKGVMLSYANLKYYISYTVNQNSLHLKKDNVLLGLIPLYHGYGYGLMLCALVLEVKIILLSKFEETLFLSTIRKYKVTHLFLVPPLMVFLAKHPLVLQYDLSNVVSIVCGAAPLSPQVVAQIKARLPSADIRQGYGMTEASVITTITPPYQNMPNTVGKLALGLQAKVIDVETGKPLQRGQPGEILLRGPCVMAGYCNNPEATKQAVDGEGWLHTGDVGYVDSEGYFYIVDRIKELIKYKGYQVAPAELEAVLLELSGVKDAAVIGLADLVAGELPIAYVVLQHNSDLTETGIINYVNGKVSPQKRIRGVRFINSIPKNPNGKILRSVLRSSLNSKL